MSDSLSDAEKIRNKRLAKLGGSTPAQASSSMEEEGPSHMEATSQAPAQPAGTSSKPQSSPTPAAAAAAPTRDQINPFSQLGLQEGTKAGPRISIKPASSSASTSLKRDRPTPPTTKATETTSIEVWEDKTLSGIFRVSLDSGKNQDYLGHRLRYVEGVRQELEEQNAPLRLTTGVLEQAIIEAAQNSGKTSPLDYLLGSWKRVSKLFRGQKAKNEPDRLEVLREARRLCMSYCIFAITTPELFGCEPTEADSLTSRLLLDQEEDRGIDHDFLLEITSRFEEDDSAKEAMVGAVEDLSIRLAQINMNGDYKPYVDALRNLVRYPACVNAFTQSPRFLPDDIPATALETDTILGPFFRISPLQRDVTSNYFPNSTTKDRGAIANSQNALRMALRAHQALLLDIVNHIIKTGKESREKTLDWFARNLNLNHKRRALQVDKTKVSTDGYMINLTVCLDQLCEPFMDATFSKVDRIDVDYLRRTPRVDIKDETKLNADQQTSDDFYAKPADGQSNFISEVFFLTLAAHHYGTEAAGSMLTQMERELRHMEKSIAELETQRATIAPHLLARVDAALKKYKEELERGMAYKYTVQGVLLDDLSQARSMQFMRYVLVWLLRLVTPAHDFPKSNFRLPLPVEQNMVFRCLPEYFLEDVVGNFKFIMRNLPQIITTTQSDELVMLCITFLRSGEYIKNPYLKAGLVTIMYAGSVPYHGKSKGVLGDILNALPFGTDYLLHALMKFFIDAEHTGAHTAFYDKFNIRYEIFQIIKCIWSNPIYREQLSVEAKVNVEFFVQFVNLLMNDVTYVLDESLSSFVKIHDLQEELAKAAEMEESVRTEKESALSEAQGKAKNFMILTNEGVAMLKLFTETLADSFTMPEVVQRLADMLDYNLDAMVGPKSSQLKVENRDEYHFNPKALLGEIVAVYLNLRKKESFVLAVARDGRSYKPANFETATTILRKWSLKSPQELNDWLALGAKFKKAKELEDQAEHDLGEIPDEFLDPLLFHLMEDPVILPTSKTTIDKSTIRSHLLSDPNDPFNRAPLTIDDVFPDTELKARIEAFKKEKMQKAEQRLAEANIMDTTPG